MLENIRLAFQGIWSHMMRSFLTMLGIIIGIASIRSSLICSLVPLIVDTIAIIAAIPIIIPSMVRRERILCAQIPWNDNLIFSNID